MGVFFGSSTGGMFESRGVLPGLSSTDRRRSRLRDLASHQVNAPGDAVARHLGVTGPVQTLSSACASGALALGAALEAVRSGEVDVALAGGSDSLCQLTYAGFNALRSVDEVPCRPFRAGRAGMSFGEGAAVLVLEPLERVLARGAEPLAVFAGRRLLLRRPSHDRARPERRRGRRGPRGGALRDAGLEPEEIDFVNAHGTGTPLNDAAEWQALQRVFGERAAELPVTATKALLGHLLGSAGAIEAVATVLCLHQRRAASGPLRRGAGGAEVGSPASCPGLAGARPAPAAARGAGGGLDQPRLRRLERRPRLLAGGLDGAA